MANLEHQIWVTSLDPIKILRVLSEDDYESLIEDWQSAYLRKKYVRVEKLGSSGDKGRDVVCTDIVGDLHYYQCKHYDRKLIKSDVLLEVGKCFFYCFKGEYPIPKKYYFVSPHGVTTYVRDLLRNTLKIREELSQSWTSTCRTKITSTEIVELEGKLLEFIDKMNFSIFDYISPKEFLSEFEKTPYYSKWFGTLKKARKLVPPPPDKIGINELIYISKILEAYSEYLEKNIEDERLLKETDPYLWDHFNRQRLYFYSAEYLAAFSRDTYPPEVQHFENLKNEMYHGVIDEIQEDARNGFERLKKVLKRSTIIELSPSNPLKSEVNIKDRQGLCHHLANEREDVRWKK